MGRHVIRYSTHSCLDPSKIRRVVRRPGLLVYCRRSALISTRLKKRQSKRSKRNAVYYRLILPPNRVARRRLYSVGVKEASYCRQNKITDAMNVKFLGKLISQASTTDKNANNGKEVYKKKITKDKQTKTVKMTSDRVKKKKISSLSDEDCHTTSMPITEWKIVVQKRDEQVEKPDKSETLKEDAEKTDLDNGAGGEISCSGNLQHSTEEMKTRTTGVPPMQALDQCQVLQSNLPSSDITPWQFPVLPQRDVSGRRLKRSSVSVRKIAARRDRHQTVYCFELLAQKLMIHPRPYSIGQSTEGTDSEKNFAEPEVLSTAHVKLPNLTQENQSSHMRKSKVFQLNLTKTPALHPGQNFANIDQVNYPNCEVNNQHKFPITEAQISSVQTPDRNMINQPTLALDKVSADDRAKHSSFQTENQSEILSKDFECPPHVSLLNTARSLSLPLIQNNENSQQSHRNVEERALFSESEVSNTTSSRLHETSETAAQHSVQKHQIHNKWMKFLKTREHFKQHESSLESSDNEGKTSQTKTRRRKKSSRSKKTKSAVKEKETGESELLKADFLESELLAELLKLQIPEKKHRRRSGGDGSTSARKKRGKRKGSAAKSTEKSRDLKKELLVSLNRNTAFWYDVTSRLKTVSGHPETISAEEYSSASSASKNKQKLRKAVRSIRGFSENNPPERFKNQGLRTSGSHLPPLPKKNSPSKFFTAASAVVNAERNYYRILPPLRSSWSDTLEDLFPVMRQV